MGSCISKCKPKKKLKQDSTHVQDKIIISQDAQIISPAAKEITKTPSHKPLYPAPSASSTASFSSLSPTSTAMASSISSSSSLSSSSSTSYSSTVLKDRSFSNDFLWSCAKENIPHLIGLKEENAVVDSSPLVVKKKQIIREKAAVNGAATPKKRLRANSPTLVRQKSFRKEQSFVSLTPNRGLRSPSPSRRFNGESNRIFPVKESYYTKPVVAKRNAVSCGPRRESFRGPRDSAMTRKSEAFPQHICSKIDGKDIDVVMEDIDNPLIALDCFIFL